MFIIYAFNKDSQSHGLNILKSHLLIVPNNGKSLTAHLLKLSLLSATHNLITTYINKPLS